ncbi:MAG: excalibur calcium-binding domain-containing protein [Pseudomonadota bacterium]
MTFEYSKESAPNQPRSRRERRADETRRKALSPMRIVLMILALPVTTIVIAAGVFLRTSEFDRTESVIHLIALAGCDAAAAVGGGPFYEGEAGYHARNDPDGDGVACSPQAQPRGQTAAAQRSTPQSQRSVGNAKFVRP